MIDHLKTNYGYIYDKKTIHIKPVKSIKYVKVPLNKDDIIEPSPKTFTEMIIDAQAVAFKEGIRANTIVINENMVKVDAFTFQMLHGVSSIPPMICGMNVYFTKNDLPDEYSFAMFDGRNATNDRLAQFESIGMEPDELRKAAEMYKRVKEIM
jgi:hypothetical protein